MKPTSPLLFSLLAFASPCAAQESGAWILSAGPVIAGTMAPRSRAGYGGGAEVSVVYRPPPTDGAAYGALVRVEGMTQEEGTGSWYSVLAAEASIAFLGAEFGLAWRTPSDRFTGYGGLHLGLFASLAYGWFGFRATAPVLPYGGGGDPPWEFGLSCGFKFPVALRGSLPYQGHGDVDRPVRVAPRTSDTLSQ